MIAASYIPRTAGPPVHDRPRLHSRRYERHRAEVRLGLAGLSLMIHEAKRRYEAGAHNVLLILSFMAHKATQRRQGLDTPVSKQIFERRKKRHGSLRRAAWGARKTRSFSKSFRVWSQVWPQNKKARAHKALTWRFNGAGDGNRTRVRSLEGFSSTIEPHPHMVGTTGFEPATSCSQSRRATKLRHVPSTVQLGYFNKAGRMFKIISFNSRALESPPPIQPPPE